MSPFNDSEVSQGLSAVLRTLLVIARLIESGDNQPKRDVAAESLMILEEDLADQGYLA